MLKKLAAVLKQSFPATKTPKIGASVIVNTRAIPQQWRVSNIKTATGTLVTIKFENNEMTVEKGWFMFYANSGSLLLQRLGFFGDMALKCTTNSYEVLQNILNPEKMMDGEALMVLLEWTIYRFSDGKKLGLKAAQSKTWLADGSFWQSWVLNNKPQRIPPVKCGKWVCTEEEPVWGNKVINDKLRTALDIRFSEHTGAAPGSTTAQPSRDIPLGQMELPKRDGTNYILQGLQLMSWDYIKGKVGYYMLLESFSTSRKCERMIAKIKFPVPLHLLDHLIIPITVRESHWIAAHKNKKSRYMSFLDSSHTYSAADYPRQKMLLWKFYKMAWNTHVGTNVPAPSWVVHPARFTSLHPRLTELTPAIVQALGQQRN